MKEKKMNNLQTYAKFRSKGTPSTPSWATNFAKSVAPKIINYYSNYENHNKLHIDLACGTGELCDYLQKKEFICFGIDIDQYAILEAKEKNSKVNFECQDFSNIETDKKFTSVSAIHDVVNSICDEKKLIEFFNKCYSLLSRNGFFIFDLITPKGFLSWNDFQLHTFSDFFMVQKCFYEEKTKTGIVQLFGFIKEENSEKYNKFEINDKVKNYNIDWIKEKLLEVGFKDVKFYNLWSDLKSKEENCLIENNSSVITIAEK